MRTTLCGRNLRRFVILTLAVVLALPISGLEVAHADSEIIPESDLIGPPIPFAGSTPNAAYPSMTWNSTANEYLAVWSVGVLYDTSVKARRFSPTGAAQGPEITLLSNGYGRFRSSVVYNSFRGEYFVVWSSAGAIYGRRLSSTGSLIGASVVITTNGRMSGAFDLIINANTGEYLVVWLSLRSGSSVYDVFAQRISSSGALVGSNSLVVSALGDTFAPNVAYNRQSNEYLLAWAERRNGIDYDIIGQRVSSIGSPIGGEIHISSATGSQMYPTIAWNSNRNQYLVVWVDTRAGQTWDVYGQRLAAAGTRLGENFSIGIGDNHTNSNPTGVAWNPNTDEYLVAWQGSQEIHAQRLAGDGALRGSRFTVGGHFVSDIVHNPAFNEYVVAWGAFLASGQRIRGQLSSPGSCANVTQIPRSECDALVALFTSTNGANWANKSGWLATNTPCSWYGVTCAGGHVTRLVFNRNGLTGTIPPELGNLTQLQQLALTGDQLVGAIPRELGNLSRLTYLNLCGNRLSGMIPSELGQLSNLYAMHLCINQLTGSIPAALGNLTNLGDELALYGNYLSGSIPRELGQLTRARHLLLSNNQLTGELPAELGNMSSLVSLDLSYNYLSGNVPSQLSNLENLTSLRLDHNLLRGALPNSLTQLSLNRFEFNETLLCEPGDMGFQAWLAGIPNLQRTGIICTALTINFTTGAPGSYFLVNGCGFPPNSNATISVNGVVLGTVQTDNRGCFTFILFTAGADPGYYVVTASANPTASALFRLSWDQPLRPMEGSGTMLNVPPGIAFDRATYVPLVTR